MEKGIAQTSSLSQLYTSLAPHPPQIHQACILTILRVVDNILSDRCRSNAKLRKIKVANPAFWKRAGQWDGSLSLLVDCGFTAVGEGENGGPLHLKFENEDDESRDKLLRGRDELAKFAVEKLEFPIHMLPECPVQREINATCNSSQEVLQAYREPTSQNAELDPTLFTCDVHEKSTKVDQSTLSTTSNSTDKNRLSTNRSPAAISVSAESVNNGKDKTNHSYVLESNSREDDSNKNTKLDEITLDDATEERIPDQTTTASLEPNAADGDTTIELSEDSPERATENHCGDIAHLEVPSEQQMAEAQPDEMTELLTEIDNELSDDILHVSSALNDTQEAAVMTITAAPEAPTLLEKETDTNQSDKDKTSEISQDTMNTVSDDNLDILSDFNENQVELNPNESSNFIEFNEQPVDQSNAGMMLNDSEIRATHAMMNIVNNGSVNEHDATQKESRVNMAEKQLFGDDNQTIHTECSLSATDKEAYQLSLRDIPLPEGEFASSDEDEMKAFYLGFELCHRLLISLWHVEPFFSSGQPQNITTGLANVKSWSKCDSSTTEKECKREDEANSMSSEPSLIVPLAVVYKAWSHLLNSKSNTASQARAIYSWIVSNHPNSATLHGVPNPESILCCNASKEDIEICNYVCFSLNTCGLVSIYGADIIAFSENVASDLSFFIGAKQRSCSIHDEKSIMLDQHLLNECHSILADAMLPNINTFLNKNDLSPDESISLWYWCRYSILHLLSSGKLDEAEQLLLDKKFARARLKSIGIPHAVLTVCSECARMTTLKPDSNTQLQVVSSRSQNSTLTNIKPQRQSRVRSLCNMSAALQDYANNISAVFNTRGFKKELGSCFQKLGESIGITGDSIAEEINQYEQALMLRLEAYGDKQDHESVADTLCRYFVLQISLIT